MRSNPRKTCITLCVTTENAYGSMFVKENVKVLVDIAIVRFSLHISDGRRLGGP